MKKKITLHILLNLVIEWVLVCLAVIFGFLFNILYIVFILPVFISCSIETFFWGRVAFCVAFNKPQTIITKGFRYTSREFIYSTVIKPTYYRGVFFFKHYSKILFDDKRLKGKYVYLDTAFFHHGESIKLTYYPRAKYIISIEKVNDTINIDSNPQNCD